MSPLQSRPSRYGLAILLTAVVALGLTASAGAQVCNPQVPLPPEPLPEVFDWGPLAQSWCQQLASCGLGYPNCVQDYLALVSGPLPPETPPPNENPVASDEDELVLGCEDSVEAQAGHVQCCNNDNECQSTESCESCPEDCGPCPCDNDGICEPDNGEDNESCPNDCYCGDGVCDQPGEVIDCPEDCGGGWCGDGHCSDMERENCSCHEDCGECCGDDICEGVEEVTCPDDCRPCESPAPGACGDKKCDPGESWCNCPTDCLPGLPSCCGDLKCDLPSESVGSCPADCLSAGGQGAAGWLSPSRRKMP
jgi:hypothetical protein